MMTSTASPQVLNVTEQRAYPITHRIMTTKKPVAINRSIKSSKKQAGCQAGYNKRAILMGLFIPAHMREET